MLNNDLLREFIKDFLSQDPINREGKLGAFYQRWEKNSALYTAIKNNMHIFGTFGMTVKSGKPDWESLLVEKGEMFIYIYR
jgi:hypothetical protein